jgi:spermidine synthase
VNSLLGNKRDSKLSHDITLIGIMSVLAACGLIYEYLLSHYAGRVIGAVDSAIYSMIGIMIVSMGIGAFAAKLIKDPFTGFTVLELLLA